LEREKGSGMMSAIRDERGAIKRRGRNEGKRKDERSKIEEGEEEERRKRNGEKK